MPINKQFYAESYVRGTKQRKIAIPKSLWHIFHVGNTIRIKPIIKNKEKYGIIKKITEESNGLIRMVTINKEHWIDFPVNCKCHIYLIKNG